MKAIGKGSACGRTDRSSKLIAAGVCFVNAGENFDQRRFSSAVLAEQRMNLAAPHIEIDTIERQASQ